MKKIISYLIQGLVVLVPVAITLYVIIKLFSIFIDFFVWIGITDNLYLDILLGFIFFLLLTFAAGVLASNYFFSNLLHYFENKFERLPLIRHIYSPIKDFIEAFIGNKKKFKHPVLISIENSTRKEIGFVTQQDLTNFGLTDYVAVYLPFSYSFAGKLVLIKKEYVEPLPHSAANTMKFIISGGISDIENKETSEKNQQ